MSHDNLEDILMEAEELGIRAEVLKKVSEIKSKKKVRSDEAYDHALAKVKKKLDKKRRTSK